MNDESLEYECFGGEYRPKVYDQCTLPFLQIHLSRHPTEHPADAQEIKMLMNVIYIISKLFVERYHALFSCS